MRLIAMADPHISIKTPRIRTDDYPETQFKKMSWVCDLANREEALLLMAGDIFDRPVSSYTWLNRYIRLFNSVKKGVYVIYGQHDIHFHHPDMIRTPLGILLESGCVMWADKIVDVCNFGETVPSEQKSDILCAHVPITQYDPPFYMPDAFSAEDFMHENKQYDWIITGDFHEHHITNNLNQVLINPGPLMRMDKGKQDYKPMVVLVDTETNEYEAIPVPIVAGVFNLDLMDTDDRGDRKEKMREFASNIEVETEDLSFLPILKQVVTKAKPTKLVRSFLDKILEGANNGKHDGI